MGNTFIIILLVYLNLNVVCINEISMVGADLSDTLMDRMVNTIHRTLYISILANEAVIFRLKFNSLLAILGVKRGKFNKRGSCPISANAK